MIICSKIGKTNNRGYEFSPGILKQKQSGVSEIGTNYETRRIIILWLSGWLENWNRSVLLIRVLSLDFRYRNYNQNE